MEKMEEEVIRICRLLRVRADRKGLCRKVRAADANRVQIVLWRGSYTSAGVRTTPKPLQLKALHPCH